MTVARRLEGPCAPLFYATTVWLTLTASLAVAQTVNRSELELCASLETSELKLACFEAIIAASKARGGQQRDAAEPPTPVSGTTEIEVSAEAVTTLATPQPAAAAVTEEAVSTAEFGQEHLDKPGKEDNKVVIKATVTEVTRGRNNILYFHLANGHVWRQIEPRYVPYPKQAEFEIDITRGMMGEYRLRIEEDGRMVRIRRVK